MRVKVVCVFLLLQVTGVFPYTLYKWIEDSNMRFNYDPDPQNALGVSNWPMTYGEDCAGLHQSPVNIQTDQVRYGVACQCPNMQYDSHIMRGELKNNGHSTTFEPEHPMLLRMSNVPYRNGTYLFNDFHLHYGGVRGRNFELQGLRFRGSGVMSAGSEHTVDGLRFEGELHFVFYNSKYGTLENADSQPDGVSIIVILVQKVPDGMANNMRFSSFLEHNIPLVAPYLANITTTVDMSMFFNRDCEFYTYPGSTTTPTCHESVRWIILKDPIQVTERAWFLLTRLQSRGDFNARFGNYRTTQPLNDRVVEANFRQSEGRALPMPDSNVIDQQQRMGQGMSMVPVESSSAGALSNAQLGIGQRGMEGGNMGFGMRPQEMGQPSMAFELQGMSGAGMNVGMRSTDMNGQIMNAGMGQRAMLAQSMGAGMAQQGMSGPSITSDIGQQFISRPIVNMGMMPQGMDGGNMAVGMAPRGMSGPGTNAGMGMSIEQMLRNASASGSAFFPQLMIPMAMDVSNPGFRSRQQGFNGMTRQKTGPASEMFNQGSQPMVTGTQGGSIPRNMQMASRSSPGVMDKFAMYWKQMMARMGF